MGGSWIVFLGLPFLLLTACGGGPQGSPDDARGLDGGSPELTLRDAAHPADRGPDMRLGSFEGTLFGEVRSGGVPLPGAVVRMGGWLEHTLSDQDGRFTLTLDAPVPLRALALTAGKEGFFSAGVAIRDPSQEQIIELRKLEQRDNPAYVFKAPDAVDAAPHCVHCHKGQVTPWRQSAHAQAARNAKLHDMYNGTALGLTDEAACVAAGGRWVAGKALGKDQAQKKCYLGRDGVLPYLNVGRCGGEGQPSCDDPQAVAGAQPLATGPCADCHAPATTGQVRGATNLNHVADIAFDSGVHCDFCHKVQKVEVNDRPGVHGAITLLRPGLAGTSGWSRPEVMFGPLSDVILVVMGNVYQPQFREAGFCSACHQWASKGMHPQDQALISSAKWQGGLPLQDTYYEWQASTWAAIGKPCQSCHMPAVEASTAALDIQGAATDASGVLGWPRPFGQVRSHRFAARLPPLGPGERELSGEPARALLRAPIAMSLDASVVQGRLRVRVALENRGAGHSIPTGTPSRQLLLLVRASAAGRELSAVDGQTVPDWTGALVQAELGAGASLVDDRLTLPSGQRWPANAAGMVVRFVEPTGTFVDYPGTRYFGEPGRTAAEKGMELARPLAAARVLSTSGNEARLERAMSLPNGARFFLGAPTPGADLSVDQELPNAPLAGAPGFAFGKVMIDAAGRRGAPFFRAVDVASDNRIPAGATATSEHVFDLTGHSGEASITATLLYRRYPWPRATQRGWQTVDVVRSQEEARLALP